ncbi:MAG: leucine--tRNA ligase [Oligoflexales bacterium]
MSFHDYDPSAIEKKWQDFWDKNKTFKSEVDPNKPKYYVLDMFPYPSGEGLHVGHPEGYTATDIVSRFKRMNGFNVLHPMGWDAFGLPAEQHAIKTGKHPKDTTEKNIANFKRQIQSIGLSYDWDREINTSDPTYFKWTQWIFLKLFEKGLAYESYEPVNWCPALGTVLANEEVIDGKSEVGGFPVEKKPIRQWVLKITEYAERLIADLEGLDWPEPVKEQQRNWIGKSVGAEIDFVTEDGKNKIRIFTTRPDTIFGATFFVLAPEHPLVATLATAQQKVAIDKYVSASASRSDRDRIANTEKTGVFLGSYVINPANRQKIPVYISDYVLMSYGHGAIMAVPAHDQRDYDFAKLFGIAIKPVLQQANGTPAEIETGAFEADGIICNSDFLDGLTKNAAIEKMCTWLEKNGLGRKTTTYKLRDWLFSRQRYWGEPIPLVKNKNGDLVAIPESELPLTLPSLSDFKPTGNAESPLVKAREWCEYKKDGQSFDRETNTMPQWAGSCWYYLRYIDPRNDHEAWAKDKEKYWMPVDLYVGGVEHAVMHLLYARFWHKVLFDLGYVSTKEPFKKLVNQGMILGENNERMSKSRGNVVNPDEVISEWGADSLRLYEMFMGPLEATKPWQTTGISGVNRFLKRAWRLLISDNGEINDTLFAKPETEATLKILHKTVKKVTEDIENMRFNTAISAMMELVNHCYKDNTFSRKSCESLILLLAPFAPHMAEELWSRFGHNKSLAWETWPTYNPEFVREDDVTMSVQINGKLRGTITIDKSCPKETALQIAKGVESVAKQLAGKEIVKEIFVPGKTISFVVK